MVGVYWLGNELLDGVDLRQLCDSLRERFAMQLSRRLLAATVGCALGVLTAWRGERRGQQGLAAALLLGSLPDFVIGIALLLAFAVALVGGRSQPKRRRRVEQPAR